MKFLFFMIVLACVVRMLVYFLKPKAKGASGEAMVGILLKGLPDDQYIVIHNLLLRTEKGTSQLDYVIVSIYGIFVIEVKNYVGYITGSEKASLWTQTIYHTKHQFMNPIHQNYGHVKAIENLLQKSEVIKMPIFPIVAFSGEAHLHVKADNSEVILWGDLKNAIRKHSGVIVMDATEMKRLAGLLQSQNVDSKETRQEHIQQIQDEKKKIQANICPRCGGQLVARKGKYGTFLGCSNYPKCRYTRHTE